MRLAWALLLGLTPAVALDAQTAPPQTAPPQTSPASSPASVPAGALDALPPVAEPALPAPTNHPVSERQARAADDAYLEGAKEIQRKNIAAAEADFARAARLNPNNRDYALALIVARESHLNELIQSAAEARRLGDTVRAESLLEQARAIDPTNPTVAQHFAQGAPAAARPRVPSLASTLAPPVKLEPTPGVHDFHLNGDPQSVVRSVYSAYGITAAFDASFTAGAPIHFDFHAISYADATRILGMLCHCFAVPVQPHNALIAKDTQENRDALSPLIEETIYLPGYGQDQMTELANLARNVFDVKQVTASPTGGFMLLRGDEEVLDQLNAVYADMLDAGSEVLFDVAIYEVDKEHIQNIGIVTPTSASLFSFLTEAQNIVNANQSTINTILQSGAITLTNNQEYNTLLEALYLVRYGGVTDANFSNALGTLGSIDGVPLLGFSVLGGASFNLSLTASDARILDDMQLRSSNHVPASFRIGERYPIVTSTYNSGTNINLTASEAALLKQYTGLSSIPTGTNIPPQITFEDLGITLKITPHVLRDDQVSLAVDMKIESLSGASVGGNPVINNRSLVSNVTVAANQTAMLGTLVSTNDLASIDGLPGLSELPGFQDVTDKDKQLVTDELLITITPHVVRSGSMHIASKRLAAARIDPSAPGFTQPVANPQENLPQPNTAPNPANEPAQNPAQAAPATGQPAGSSPGGLRTGFPPPPPAQ
jgi:type II secretory pathway component GspD/PulD (secretin)